MDEIKRGDVVRLKSGGPPMTVGEVVTAEDVKREKEENNGDSIGVEGECMCAWFENTYGMRVSADPPWGAARQGTFHVDMLEKVAPTEPVEAKTPDFSTIHFTYEGVRYTAPPSFEKTRMVVLPNGSVLVCDFFGETAPPTPVNLRLAGDQTNTRYLPRATIAAK